MQVCTGVEYDLCNKLATENSKWWTGGHFEVQKMWGCIKQTLLIFSINIFNVISRLENESRHPQLHVTIFRFLISQFLTNILAFFLIVLGKWQFQHVLVNISANIYQIVMKFWTNAEYYPFYDLANDRFKMADWRPFWIPENVPYYGLPLSPFI